MFYIYTTVLYAYINSFRNDVYDLFSNTPVFTINFLTYQPGGLVPMEFLQVPLEFTSPPYQDNFVQGLDQRLKLIGSVGFEMYGCT